jgi:hypothetical protein
LASLCTLFNIHDELLFLLFEFRSFAIKFTLRLSQRALVLPQSLSWRDSPPEQCFLKRNDLGSGMAARKKMKVFCAQ